MEALNADPAPIVALTVPQIVAHYEEAIRALPEPPIIIGHSAGGAFTQILLDHGFGAAGVALNSAPTEGVRVVAAVAGEVDVPGAEEPGEPAQGGAAVTSSEWQYAFTNTFTEEEGRAALRALRHPGQRRHPVGQRAGQLPARPPGHLGRLPQRQPGAAAVRLRLRGPHHAAGDAGVERQALQVRAPSPNARSTRGTRTCCRRRRAGSRSPTRCSTGPCSTPK